MQLRFVRYKSKMHLSLMLTASALLVYSVWWCGVLVVYGVAVVWCVVYGVWRVACGCGGV